WDCWDHGTPLNFKGDHYAFTLMTPEFSPAPIPDPIPIHLAAVNAYNIQLAAELADALRVHPFCTPEYLRDIIWPNVRIGAARAGRSPNEIAIIGCGFIATGATESVVQAAREQARERIAFYASTRTYLPVLEHHGCDPIVSDLRRLIAENRWGDLKSLV